MAEERKPDTTTDTGTPTGTKKKTFVEEVEVTGDKLVDRIKGLLEDANARRVIIRSQDGDEMMTLPLTFGVVAGGLITFAAPLLAAIGALAALVSRVKLEIIREMPDTETASEDEPVAKT